MNHSSGAKLTIGITGASGYLGSRIAAHLEALGYPVVRFMREPRPDSDDRAWSLGDSPDAQLCSDIDLLIHCAWDMRESGRDAVFATNVAGTERLLAAAQAAGVARSMLISSMSAFNGCESNYGQAKLAAEKLVGRSQNAIIIRPGLVYGDAPGGVVGALLGIARRTPVMPMIGLGNFRLYTCHEDDLLELIAYCISARDKLPTEPLLAAAPHSIAFRDIIRRLAQRRLLFIPFPWRFIWLLLKGLEALGLRSRLKSDSLIGLVKSDPGPDFSAADTLPVSFRSLSR
jgi:nucleoside-diphosphate-sugar epimerase